jgi:hypothetical protein
MPMLAPAVIAAIIGATATGVGTAANLWEQGNQANPKFANPTATPLTSTQNAGQTAAVSQQLPNIQALTGGSLSPEYYASIGGTNAGLGNSPQSTGNIQQAISQYFGLSAPGDTGLTPTGSGPSGGPGITSLTGSAPPSTGSGSPDIMSLLRGSGGSGGNGVGNWIQSVLNNNQFSGLQA